METVPQRLPSAWTEWVEARESWYHLQLALEHAIHSGNTDLVDAIVQALPELEVRYPAILHKMLRQFLGLAERDGDSQTDLAVEYLRRWYDQNLMESP